MDSFRGAAGTHRASDGMERILEEMDRYEEAVRRLRWPKRLVLVRHGRSEGNSSAAFYAFKADAYHALTQEGREQARAAGQELRRVVGGGTVQVIGASRAVRPCPFALCFPCSSRLHLSLQTYSQFFTSSYRRTRETLDGLLSAMDSSQFGTIMQDHRLREQEVPLLRPPFPQRVVKRPKHARTLAVSSDAYSEKSTREARCVRCIRRPLGVLCRFFFSS